jgi:hypothetical protein
MGVFTVRSNSINGQPNVTSLPSRRSVAIALVACPGFRPVVIAAMPAVVRILNFDEVEVLFPVEAAVRA